MDPLYTDGRTLSLLAMQGNGQDIPGNWH